jgi:soluble lytic murein transglycosylase-like protein
MATVVDLITAEAQRQGLDPSIAIEVARAESNLDPNVGDSSAGAIGLFQLEPATAAQLGVNPRDVNQNISGGITYLRQMLGTFGNIATALAAYNWGPGNVSQAVAQWGANFLAHAPGETQSYVRKILANLGQYRATVTPQSVANGVVSMLTPAAPAADDSGMVPVPPDNRLAGFVILTAIGIGVYLVAEVFAGD